MDYAKKVAILTKVAAGPDPAKKLLSLPDPRGDEASSALNGGGIKPRNLRRPPLRVSSRDVDPPPEPTKLVPYPKGPRPDHARTQVAMARQRSYDSQAGKARTTRRAAIAESVGVKPLKETFPNPRLALPKPKPTLRVGEKSVGSRVGDAAWAKARQQKLLNAGFSLGAQGADGKWGRRSQAAWAKFQRGAHKARVPERKPLLPKAPLPGPAEIGKDRTGPPRLVSERTGTDVKVKPPNKLDNEFMDAIDKLPTPNERRVARRTGPNTIRKGPESALPRDTHDGLWARDLVSDRPASTTPDLLRVPGQPPKRLARSNPPTRRPPML